MLPVEASSDIKTGDLLLFSNWSHTGLSIKLATANQWNHVGIAVWLKASEVLNMVATGQSVKPVVTTTRDQERELYCFETNNNAVYNRLTHKHECGSRLVSINVLKHNYTTIAWRPLNINREGDFYLKFWNFVQEYNDHPYHHNRFRMVLSTLNIYLDKNEPDGKDTFCSQLVARYLQYFNLLPLEPPAYTYLPHHFADGATKVPEVLFNIPEIVFYSRPSLAWYWIIILLIIAMFIWLILLGRNHIEKIFVYPNSLILTEF